jgi:hypothetical protein
MRRTRYEMLSAPTASGLRHPSLEVLSSEAMYEVLSTTDEVLRTEYVIYDSLAHTATDP